MSYLKKYPSLNTARGIGIQPPALSGGLEMPTMTGLSTDNTKEIERIKKEIYGNVSADYAEAEGSLMEAESNFDQAIKDAYRDLGTPETIVNEAYDKLLKETGQEIKIMSSGGYEGSYIIPYAVIEQMWDQMHSEGMGDMITRVNKDGSLNVDGDLAFWQVDVGDYGGEVHESLGNMPNQIKGGMLESAMEAHAEGLSTIGDSETEGLATLLGYRGQLDTAGYKLGGMVANEKMGLDKALKGSSAEAGYDKRRQERQTGFKVLGGGV